MTQDTFKSGYVNIIGRPNVGKSTLMNVLVGERMSIINKKPQTTRHRILGIHSTDTHQLVFSDTPGIIYNPAYGMQYALNKAATSALEDADILIVMTDFKESFDMPEFYLRSIAESAGQKVLVINKVDLMVPERIGEIRKWWREQLEFQTVFEISALNKTGTDAIMAFLLKEMPPGPEYFPKDQLTDRPERFFVSEIIRNQILELYHQEIPYSTEVVVTEYKEEPDIIRIHAEIYVSRKTQKAILIGKGGKAIKQLGIDSRKDMESWLGKKVYLELYVRVKDNWRDDNRLLERFGYR